MTLFRRCSSPLTLLLVITACAQPGPPPASPAPTAVAPIYTPNPIQPRLLPGNPATALPPEQQAAFTLQQGMRQDQRRDQLNAIDPNRPQSSGDPNALGGTNPFSSDMGDAQYPGMPSQAAPIFRRIGSGG